MRINNDFEFTIAIASERQQNAEQTKLIQIAHVSNIQQISI